MFFSLYDFGLLVTTVVALFVFFLKWKSSYWQRKKVPTFPTHLIYGNLNNPFTHGTNSSVKFLELYQKAKKENLKYVGLYGLFQTPILLTVNRDHLKSIMTKDFQFFTDRGTSFNERDDPLSAHLFALSGQKWRNLRTKMTPTFTAGKMKQMFQTMAECGSILQKILDDKTEVSNGIDIKDVLACYTTDIICSCAFGLNAHSSTDPNSEFRKYGKRVFEHSIYRSVRRMFLQGFPKLSNALHLKRVPEDISTFFFKVVEDTVNYRKSNNYIRNDFLQLMIDIQEKDESMTLGTIAAQCFVFFLAGFETSSTTMTFALYELATNPEVQEKTRKDVQNVLEKHDGKITYESMMDMKYLGQVIDETLRKWPPAANIARQCIKDYEIPDEDVVIEKGTMVLIPIMGLHRDAEYYPDPERFDPDRLSDENKKNIPDYAYMPFGEGPRMCIGMRFGLMQTKVGLASILRNYRVTLNKKTTIPLILDKNSLVTSIEGNLWLNLEKI